MKLNELFMNLCNQRATNFLYKNKPNYMISNQTYSTKLKEMFICLGNKKITCLKIKTNITYEIKRDIIYEIKRDITYDIKTDVRLKYQRKYNLCTKTHAMI